MLYTRKGDDGTTGLFGTKTRIPKQDPLIEALGSLDELNSLTGLCKAWMRHNGHERIAIHLTEVQEALFVAQAELAGADTHIVRAHVDALETSIANIEAAITKPASFVVPGATVLSALLDLARAVTRRAERRAIMVREERELSLEFRAYLNRLSSFFYALARQVAQEARAAETPPTYVPPSSLTIDNI